MNSALICSLLANIHRDEKKRPEPFEVDDFMMIKKEEKAPKPQTREEQIAIAEMWGAAMVGKIRRREEVGEE